MAVQVNSPSEIQAMREGGKILAGILNDIRPRVLVGATGVEIDAWVHEQIIARGATPTYKDPDVNFPGVICISINDMVVHGVPSNYAFQKGDIVGFDLVITYKNMKTDAAFTMMVGQEPTGEHKRLIDMTERSLFAAIDAIKGTVHTGDIGAAVQKVLTENNLGVVKDLVGHGVGREMHQPPDVPNYGHPGTGTVLHPGNTIAIEPMATLGSWEVIMDNDHWTIRTKDGSLSAHFEHTVLITENGCEVLTML